MADDRGRRGTPEYRAWTQMKYRCYNPNYECYPRYGGRGIRVASEWLRNFRAFLSHVGKRPGPEYSLDRIDTDGDYAPGNVRWATSSQQRRSSMQTRMLTVDGITLSVTEWAGVVGTGRETLYSRLKRGWDVESVICGKAGVSRA